MISSTLVSYLSFEKFFDESHEYIALEIHGEVTDASIVYDNLIEESASYPTGSNSIIRAVATKTHKKPEDVASRMKLMTQAQAERDSKHSQTLEDVVYEAIGDWVDGLYKALKKVARGRPVPQTAFLLADPEWEVLYTTALKDRSFELFTFTDRPFSIISANSSTIRSKTILKTKGECIPLIVLTGLIHNQLQIK